MDLLTSQQECFTYRNADIDIYFALGIDFFTCHAIYFMWASSSCNPHWTVLHTKFGSSNRGCFGASIYTRFCCNISFKKSPSMFCLDDKV